MSKRLRQNLITLTALTAFASVPSQAGATEFSELGQGLDNIGNESAVDLSGFLRLRGESLYNLDLDHGLTPSGLPLYPVPLGDPTGQRLDHSDARFRTDISLYAPFGQVRVNSRIDVVDNLTLGSTPRGIPSTTTSQDPPRERVFRIKRVWGEALTPFGVIAAGRMGNTWGLGMLSNGGDCLQCDSGDAADRIAFVTSRFNHFVAVAYDIGWVGPTATRKVETREIDLGRSDNLHTVNLALLRQRDALALDRRNRAGKVTFDYGAVFSHRWQRDDIPATYVPTTEPVEIDDAQVIERNFSAQAYDVWLRLVGPNFRIEGEVAMLRARINETSVLPGTRFDVPSLSTQFGAALETDFGPYDGRFKAGVDLGVASGDSAYGFGASPSLEQTPGQPGDLEGSQANPPYDNSVNNFRFHPDYRIDQILFREIIGTVTDAFYLRPHVSWDAWKATAGVLRFDFATVASRAIYSSSTPGGAEPLGIELDPSVTYLSRDKFGLSLDYAVLFPLAGLDNVAQGISAKPAQSLRLQLTYGF